MNESATSFPAPLSATHRSDALARPCPRCSGSMVPFATTSNSGGHVELDYCKACRSVWFDAKESVQLSGLGWVALLRLLATLGEAATDFGPSPFHCPRCRMVLNAMHNQTRTGRFVLYRCTGCGGHFQTQVGLLSQWGHFRQALAADWTVLAKEGQALACQSCGAGIAVGAAACSHCKTPAFVVDVARLSQSLQLPDMKAALADIASPSQSARAATWPCHACGSPLDPLVQARCEQCQHPVVVTQLSTLLPALEAAEQQLKNPPAKKAEPELPRNHAKPTEAQLKIDRMTSGFSAQGDRREMWVGCAYAFFLFLLLALVKCMHL